MTGSTTDLPARLARGWPVWFGPESGPLAGWYHPATSPRRAAAVLLCPPLGVEHVSAYRTLRLLARRLAGLGFPVLRFDYYGTGNSAGDYHSGGLVARWLDDVGAAVAEARRLSGAERIAVVGLRMGATLAAAAARSGPFDGMVLWNACSSGRGFVREARALQQLIGHQPPLGTPQHDGLESAGFMFSAETTRDLGGLTLLSASAAPARRILMIERDDRPPEDAFAGQVAAQGAIVERQVLAGGAELTGGSMKAEVPRLALDAIARWLDQQWPVAAEGAPVPPADCAAQAVAVAAADGTLVLEAPVFFGDGGRMFGVWVEPAQRDSSRPVILLPNTGADHHIGPHRLYVHLGRQWAALGFSVLRFDISGIGESLPGPAGTEYVVYAPEGLDDLRTAAAFAREGGREVVVVGLCSGGYFAVHAVLAGERFAECIAVNPQLYWRAGAGHGAAAVQDSSQVRRYRRSVRSLDKWRRVIAGDVNLARVVRQVVSHGARAALQVLRGSVTAVRAGQRPASIEAQLRTLATRRVPVFLLFGRGDEGLLYLEARAGRTLQQLRGQRRLELEVIDGADHTFMPLWCQQLLGERLTRHLVERHPAAGA